MLSSGFNALHNTHIMRVPNLTRILIVKDYDISKLDLLEEWCIRNPWKTVIATDAKARCTNKSYVIVFILLPIYTETVIDKLIEQILREQGALSAGIS